MWLLPPLFQITLDLAALGPSGLESRRAQSPSLCDLVSRTPLFQIMLLACTTAEVWKYEGEFGRFVDVGGAVSEPSRHFGQDMKLAEVIV